MTMSKRNGIILKMWLNKLMGKQNQAQILEKSNLFKKFGGGGYWHPLWLPSYPNLISIGSNVTIAADVRFYEHDVVHRIWNCNPLYKDHKIKFYTGEIIVGDNVVICARSIILYNVHIGSNVIIAAGSVVTKDVPDDAIVAGNPARIIGSTKDLLRKRMIYSGIENNSSLV